jgi:hypothetical protein
MTLFLRRLTMTKVEELRKGIIQRLNNPEGLQEEEVDTLIFYVQEQERERIRSGSKYYDYHDDERCVWPPRWRPREGILDCSRIYSCLGGEILTVEELRAGVIALVTMPSLIAHDPIDTEAVALVDKLITLARAEGWKEGVEETTSELSQEPDYADGSDSGRT